MVDEVCRDELGFRFDVIGNDLLGNGTDALGCERFMVGVSQPAIAFDLGNGIGEVGVRLSYCQKLCMG